MPPSNDPFAARRKELQRNARGLPGADDRGYLSRVISDAGGLLGSLPRAIGTMVGAPLSDVWALAPGGRAAGTFGRATGGLLGEAALSMGRTAAELPVIASKIPTFGLSTPFSDSVSELTGMAYSGLGWERGSEILEEEREFSASNPISSAVEDIGNIAIVGSLAAKPLGAAGRAAAGVKGAAPLGRASRPFAGRSARMANLETNKVIAQAGGPGSRAARAAVIADDVIGHPYRAAFRRMKSTPTGQAAGQAARNAGMPIRDEFYERFPRFRPEAREARALHQDLVRENIRDVRLGALDRFDPDNAIPDAQQALRGMESFEPETLEAIGANLPDRSIMDRVRGRETLTDADTVEMLRAVRDLHDQGQTVMPKYADTEGRLRLDLTILALDENLSGLGRDVLTDQIPWYERLDSAYPLLRQQQKTLRAAGFTDEMLRELYGGERFLLDERLLDDTVDAALRGEDLPPVPEGQTRLWRAEDGAYTPDRAYATRSLGEGGRLEYVDVPEGVGEELVTVYRSHRQSPLDPSRIGDEGARFTTDLEYALNNTNGEAHALLYETEVPRSRLISQESPFAEALGTAGPDGALLKAEEAVRARRVDAPTERGGPRYQIPEEHAARTREVPQGNRVQDDLSRARQSYRKWNDVEEESLLRNQRIPDEGTRFRYVRDEQGNVLTDEQGLAQIDRVADPSGRVPYESQGGSAAQNRTLRRKQRFLGKAQTAMERTSARLADQNVNAKAELHELHRKLARDMENLSKRAVALGDAPEASALWDEWFELQRQVDELADGGGLTVPQRVRTAMGDVESALDEVIILATTPALREMLTPESYGRVTRALSQLREAEEFFDANAERFAFFDALDATEKIGRGHARGRAAEARAMRGEGRRSQEAQAAVKRARQQASRAQDAAEGLFDSDAAIARLQDATQRYKAARQPFEETLLKQQTRAREALNRAARQQRSLETLERRFAEAQAEVARSIDAAPAPARDLLWLERTASVIAEDLDRLVTDGVIDIEIIDQLSLGDLPQTLDDVMSAGYDVSYVPDFTATPESAAPPSVTSPVVREAATTRRRGGGTAPLEASFRETLVRRITDLRVEEFKQQFADEVSTKFGKSPDRILSEAGIPDETIAAWRSQDPGKMERELKALGYTEIRFGELFEFRQRGTRVATEGASTWMKNELASTIKTMSQSSAWDDFLREVWNPVTTAWKRSILALRPAWHVYNAVGGAVLSTFAGGLSVGDLLDFMPVATEAWRRHKLGYSLADASLDNLPLGRLGERAGRRLQAQGIERLPDITEANSTLFEHGITHRDLALDSRDTGASALVKSLPGVRRGLATKAGQKVESFGGKVNRVTTASYRANAAVDDIYRSTVYLARTMKYGDAVEPALTRVMNSMGDYAKMSPFEKRYVRSVYPFYAWVRHITGVTMRSLHPNSITRTMILARVTQILSEPNEHEEMLPGWASGDIHLWGGGEDGSTPTFLSTRGLNPFADVLAPMEVGGHFNLFGIASGMHPALRIPFESATGLSTLTGRPFSTPNPKRDEMGNELPTAPPLREQLMETLPQVSVARDLGRALFNEPTLRYGTGEPLLIPGAQQPNPASRVAGLFGANIRPIDVESMRVREIKNRYSAMRQAMRYEAQVSEQSEQQGLPLLPDALGGR